MSLGPSLGHVGVALACLGLGAGLWMLGLRGPHWQGALLAIGVAWSRELSQKWRSPSNEGPPLTFANIRQAGWPTIAVFAVAMAVEIGKGWAP